MAEYVDLDTPLEVYRYYGSKSEPISTTLRELLDFNKIPYTSADVVTIVRCKEGKHGTRLVCDLAGNEGIECRHGNIAHRLDWFCADGEKMDTEEQEAVYDPDKFFGRK